jgi:hypothetical protein
MWFPAGDRFNIGVATHEYACAMFRDTRVNREFACRKLRVAILIEEAYQKIFGFRVSQARLALFHGPSNFETPNV